MPPNTQAKFDLYLIISGICTFVPDKTGGRMMILMPPAHGHTPFLTVDEAHLTAGQTAPSMNPHREGLRRTHVSVPGLGQALDLKICKTIANTSALSTLFVDDECFQSVPPARLESRVLLSGGAIRECLPAGCWDVPYPRKPRTQVELTHRVLWGIEGIEQAPVTIELNEWNKGSRQLDLYPVAGSITVFITNDLRGPAGPAPKKGDRAPHFGHHFDLFKPTAKVPDPSMSPTPVKNDGCGSGPTSDHAHPLNQKLRDLLNTDPPVLTLFTDAYTCMVSTACPCEPPDPPCPEPDPDALDPCEGASGGGSGLKVP